VREKTRSVDNAHLGKSSLPDFSLQAQLFPAPKRETALDKLNGPLNAGFSVQTKQNMEMIGHDDELMDLEFAGKGVRAEHIDLEVGRALRLEKVLARDGP